MGYVMLRTRARTKQTKRLDTMLTLPLAPFRRALTHLTSEELSALEARIGVHTIRNRWVRGGHGIERHRSPNELGRLERRQAALRREWEARQSTLPAPVSLIDYVASVAEPVVPEVGDRAA
jgi:hypothetical protein